MSQARTHLPVGSLACLVHRPGGSALTSWAQPGPMGRHGTTLSLPDWGQKLCSPPTPIPLMGQRHTTTNDKLHHSQPARLIWRPCHIRHQHSSPSGKLPQILATYTAPGCHMNSCMLKRLWNTVQLVTSCSTQPSNAAELGTQIPHASRPGNVSRHKLHTRWSHRMQAQLPVRFGRLWLPILNLSKVRITEEGSGCLRSCMLLPGGR